MAQRAILVVDDEADIRTTLRMMLEAAGYAVATAANGDEAIREIDGRKFDLVITDLLMPGKDGIEVLVDLRKRIPELPVVAISGGGHMPRGDYLALAKRLGARAILGKPFDSEQLLSTVGLLLPGGAVTLL